MLYNKRDNLLECQACGEVVKVLSDSEAQDVAANPYNYIVYCYRCIKNYPGIEIEEGYNF